MSKTPHWILAIAMTALALFVSLGISDKAQAQTYQSWENPDATGMPAPQGAVQPASDERLADLIKRLNALVDRAEKDKAADPVFLQDLRALSHGFDRPWSTRVLFDDFADGDFTRGTPWTVASGRYWIEKGWGLRNALDPAKNTTTSKDPAAVLLGNILNKALGKETTTNSKAKYQPTTIYTPAPIANAFSIELGFTSWLGEGTFLMGPYQGEKRDAAYLLIYSVGGGLELQVRSTRGVRTIGSAPGPFKLEDKKVHTVLWTRTADGTMAITLDGKAVINVRDNSFRDAFSGFGVSTRGGDFIVKQVVVDAGP